MRFIAIVMIVFHHCLTVFYLFPPSDLTSIGFGEIGFFLSNFAKVYGLGIFTFISGFLLVNSRQDSLSWSFILHKAKKILLPCFLTALVYYLFFSEFCVTRNTIKDTHLWYLPMIFVFYLLLPILKSKSIRITIGGVLVAMFLFVVFGRITDIKLFSDCLRYYGYFVTGALLNKYFRLGMLKSKELILLAVSTMLFIKYGTIFPTIGIIENSGMMSPVGVAIEIICLYFLFCHIRVSNKYKMAIVNYDRQLGMVKKVIFLVSKHSYQIYLLHMFVINLSILYLPRNIPCFKYVFAFLTFSMAIVLPIIVTNIWNYLITCLRCKT